MLTVSLYMLLMIRRGCFLAFITLIIERSGDFVTVLGCP